MTPQTAFICLASFILSKVIQPIIANRRSISLLLLKLKSYRQ